MQQSRLRQIYIPLRALTEKPISYKKEEGNESKIVVELEKEVLDWIVQEDTRDTIRLISGGPGSGKSSFLKMISTKIASESSVKLIFIPLHLISFNNSLDDSINTYLSKIAGISLNELFDLNEKIILIFDGLDELASQGEGGGNVARDFSNELQRTLRLHNSKKVKVKAIVSGRDIVIQNEKKYLKVFNYELLPYFIENLSDEHDPFNLRFIDQRDIWWNKYGSLKNINVNEILKQIKSENLQEITSQPLLNYLVAILIEVGSIELSKQTTINQIYEHLLKEVYRRGWEHHEVYGPIQSINCDQFLMILQEISYTAWKNNGRTTSIKSIVEQCKYMRIDHILETFTKSLKTDEKSSLTKLLTAFYFKANENLDSILDQTFEFTHKSFSDYLIALKTEKFLRYLSEDLELSKETCGGRGKNILEVSESFITYFRGALLKDGNMLQFFKNKILEFDDLNIVKIMLIDILKFISSDNDLKSVFSYSSLEKINKDFFRIYCNLIEILNVFYEIDGVVIDLDSTEIFSFLQKQILRIEYLDSKLISIFVINSQLDKNLFFGSELQYDIRMLSEYNNFGFLSFFNHYLGCSIVYNNLNDNSILINGHGTFRTSKLTVVSKTNLSFLSCNIVGCLIYDVDEITLHESIIVDSELNNVKKVFLNKTIVYKNLKVNGVVIDDLDSSKLELLGIFIEKEKTELV